MRINFIKDGASFSLYFPFNCFRYKFTRSMFTQTKKVFNFQSIRTRIKLFITSALKIFENCAAGKTLFDYLAHTEKKRDNAGCILDTAISHIYTSSIYIARGGTQILRYLSRVSGKYRSVLTDTTIYIYTACNVCETVGLL